MRKSIHIVLVGACCAGLFLGCRGTEVGPLPNPVPTVEAASPTVVTPNPAGAAVELFGVGFLETSQALWDGAPRPTTFLGSGHLSVQLSAADLTAATGDLSVRNPEPGGGVSGPLTLTVANPAPTLSGMAPTEALAVVTSGLTLAVQGADFVDGAGSATVHWDGIPLETTVLGPTALEATVPDYLLRTGRSAAVTVVNPGPGGGESYALDFELRNPVPTVSGTDPEGLTVNAETAIDVLGTGFVYGASAWVGGSELTPVRLTATRMSIVVPASLAVAATTPQLSVENPGPGGGLSNAIAVDVWEVPPVIDQIAPSYVLPGAPGFTLIIYGRDFDPLASVAIDGAPRAATVVSSTRIEVAISSAEVASPGSIQVTVSNPGTGIVATAELVVLDVSSDLLLAGISSNRTQVVVADEAGAIVTTAPIHNGGHRIDASPIGTTVIYHDGRIYETDVFTGSLRRVTGADADGLFDEEWARYSPDGQWIYFMARAPGFNVYRTPADGGPKELLVGGGDRGYPAPSHSGDRMVYTIGVSPSNPNARIYIYDLVTEETTPLNVRGHTARWTPNDDWIVYWVPQDRELRAIRPDGTGDFALTTNLDVAPGFDVSPDGQWVAAVRENTGAAILVSFPDGQVVPRPELGGVGSAALFGP